MREASQRTCASPPRCSPFPGRMVSNGVEAAARGARYQTLSARTRDLGARIIAVAHTADDQMETVLMRAASGSSWRGLAGMAAFAPAPCWPQGRGLRLVRPLLDQRRAALRDYLRARSANWIEDPSNGNAVFERVRVRARLAELEKSGADVVRLAQLAARIRPHVDRLDAEAAALIAGAVAFDGPVISIERAAWSAPDHVRRRALSVLITAAAGARSEPPGDANERLDAKMQAGNFSGASLGGAVVAAKRAHFCIERDLGALEGRADGAMKAPPLPLTPHGVSVWDGRLELRVPEPGWSVAYARDGAELRRGADKRALARLDRPKWRHVVIAPARRAPAWPR